MAKLRKAFVPYIVQPPSFVQPDWGLGINAGLKFASSIPYEACHSSTFAVGKPTLVSGHAAYAYGVTAELGKVARFTNGTLQGIEVTGFNTPNPPLSVMIGFRWNTLATNAAIISFAGSGSAGGGWVLWKNTSNQLVFTFGGVADYIFTGTTFTNGVDYVLVFTVTGNGGTATPYVIRKDTNAISTDTPQTVGTMTTASDPLTLACDTDNTAYYDAAGIDIGSYAIWNRALKPSEAYSLLGNPYQIWTIPSHGGFSGVTPTLTGVSSTAAVGTVTATQGTLLALTGVSSTLSLAGLQALQKSLLQTGVSSTSGVGALAYAAVSHGVQANSAIGSLSVDVSPAITGVEETSAVGTFLLLDPTQAITGVESTTAINGVAPDLSFTLTGLASVVSVGSVVNSLDTGLLADVLISGAVGSFGTIATSFVDITGNESTGSVGTLGVDYSPDRSFDLTSVSATGQVGTLTATGGTLFVGIPTGGLATKQKKQKKTAVERDYSLIWLMEVLGSEEKYFRPKIRQYYPQISDNSISHVINNVITEMRHYFVANPDNLSQSEIMMKENVTVKFYSLKALQIHNSKVKIDETPFRPGMLS